ncbi:MAG: RluA family pseudouridine synthase [Acidobacteria bacterium]|nr:RluA family pseudouridine synthase [Acidobacteriota bacterium]
MTFTATSADAGQRLDLCLLGRFPEQSRSRLQEWIKAGRVRVNGAASKASYTLRGTEVVEVEPAAPPPLRASAEDLPLEILYQDDDVVAINKPAGMAVHPGAGRPSGTLVNALLHHFAGLSAVSGDERPGIVHRLDKETSGVLLVARHDAAHRHLARQFAGREVEKVYLALVQGQIRPGAGRIQRPIARDPVRRVRMTARLDTGRAAVTDYRVLRRFQEFTFLEVRIGTGRTHQIRVHLAFLGHPVAGDRLYGARAADYGRFFLHAHRIAFKQPSTGRRIAVEAPLPAELERWLAALL